ncbi:hypothetical protein PGAAJM_03520 [Kocuria varians]|nr:hypothetical protein [Kocuria varians]
MTARHQGPVGRDTAALVVDPSEVAPAVGSGPAPEHVAPAMHGTTATPRDAPAPEDGLELRGLRLDVAGRTVVPDLPRGWPRATSSASWAPTAAASRPC